MATETDREGTPHRPVMPDEVVEGLAPAPGQTVLDGTVGCAGHALLFSRAVGEAGRVIGLDRDPDALDEARRRLAAGPAPFELIHANYADMAGALRKLGRSRVDRVFLDIGVSSLQLDRPERGFSFSADGPLDMRMDPTRGETAADLILRLPESELADVFYQYGEERQSRRIAKTIADARRREPIETTGRLAALVCEALRRQGGRIHPATRVFQALRIVVNGELDALEQGLTAGIGALTSGGRLAVITFHSLEDRLAKRLFRSAADDGAIRWVNKKVIKPTHEECRVNRRSRSAKLRVVERL